MPAVVAVPARRRALLAVVAVTLGIAAVTPAALAAPMGGKSQVRHVFVIVLENESAAVSFGPASPAAYLSKTLPARGEFVPNYYGVGHASLDNYVAMISGQAPNPSTQADCGVYADFTAGGALGSFGQQPGSGCVYPSDVTTLPAQLQAAGFSWRSYDEDMGADPSRESATCGHPVIGQPDHTEAATATDMYASRHDPFVYFHSIIDNAALCHSHVVNLSDLPRDLSRVGSTRNYTFITPNLCHDGHDANCANGQTGGLPAADAFLSKWVPRITASPAFREDGLLMVIFDEAAGGDSSSCCGELPGPAAPEPGGTGPGGGRTGAVLLSPCIAPGTVTQRAYNHYTMLGSVENIFGVSHLGYAGLPGSAYFGTDIYKRQCGPAPPQIEGAHGHISAPSKSGKVQFSLGWHVSTAGGTPVAYSELQERGHGAWRTIYRRTRRTTYSFVAAPGTYRFRIRAANRAGQLSRWSAETLGAVP